MEKCFFFSCTDKACYKKTNAQPRRASTPPLKCLQEGGTVILGRWMAQNPSDTPPPSRTNDGWSLFGAEWLLMQFLRELVVSYRGFLLKLSLDNGQATPIVANRHTLSAFMTPAPPESSPTCNSHYNANPHSSLYTTPHPPLGWQPLLFQGGGG